MKAFENTMKITVNSEQEMDLFAKVFCKMLQGTETIFLTGDLGAGKTTLTKSIAKFYGVKEDVISPTFVLQKKYEGSIPVYHYDFYRLDDISQIRDIEFYDEIGMPGLKIIEWADKFPALSIYADYQIHIRIIMTTSREILIRKSKQEI